MRFVSKCEMWSRNAISDFLFYKNIFVNSFSWSCLIISSFMFRLFDSSFFEMTNALTRMTHQTWRKRFIKLDTSDISLFLISNISLNLTKCISSNLIKLDIKFDSCVLSNFDERYLIKLDKDLSNLTISHQTRREFCLFSLMNVFEWRAKM